MSSEYIALPGDQILVTGSNGFIGSKVVEKLLEYGFTNLRCFIRPSGHLARLQNVLDKFEAGRVKFVTGDLLSSRGRRRKVIRRSVYEFGADHSESDGCIPRIWKAEALRECEFLCRLFELWLETRRP